MSYKDPIVQKEYQQNHYQKYKEGYLKRQLERRIKMKLRAVEYLGGKCIRCGYNKSIAALDFHHRDPNEKEQRIARLVNYKWETIQKELDKCDLLCSNCHREEHNEFYGR